MSTVDDYSNDLYVDATYPLNELIQHVPHDPMGVMAMCLELVKHHFSDAKHYGIHGKLLEDVVFPGRLTIRPEYGHKDRNKDHVNHIFVDVEGVEFSPNIITGDATSRTDDLGVGTFGTPASFQVTITHEHPNPDASYAMALETNAVLGGVRPLLMNIARFRDWNASRLGKPTLIPSEQSGNAGRIYGTQAVFAGGFNWSWDTAEVSQRIKHFQLQGHPDK